MEQTDYPVGSVHVGRSGLFPEVEDVLERKELGTTGELTLMPGAALGVYDSSLVFTDDLANVPIEFHHVGAIVPMESENGGAKTFRVRKMDSETLTIDGNEPVAD